MPVLSSVASPRPKRDTEAEIKKSSLQVEEEISKQATTAEFIFSMEIREEKVSDEFLQCTL